MKKRIMAVLLAAFFHGPLFAQTYPSPTPTPSPWELHFGLGWAFPINDHFAADYRPGPFASLGLGHALDPELSLLLDLDAALFRIKGFHSIGGNNLDILPFSLDLYAKREWLTGDLRPYVFGGPGVCADHQFYGPASPPIPFSRWDFNFMLTAGLGLEFQWEHDLILFLQGMLKLDFRDEFGWIRISHPATYLPLELGVSFPL
jgi:hypothetical protein